MGLPTGASLAQWHAMVQPVTSLPEHFGAIPDPRVDRTRQHLLIDMLVMATGLVQNHPVLAEWVPVA